MVNVGLLTGCGQFEHNPAATQRSDRRTNSICHHPHMVFCGMDLGVKLHGTASPSASENQLSSETGEVKSSSSAATARLPPGLL